MLTMSARRKPDRHVGRHHTASHAEVFEVAFVTSGSARGAGSASAGAAERPAISSASARATPAECAQATGLRYG
jgi:hypothetical protein